MMRTLTGLCAVATLFVVASCSDPDPETTVPTTVPVLTTAPPNLTTTTTEPIVQRQIYTVQPGNTLGQIAAAFNTTVEAIMEENALEDTVLTIGQPLVIPPPTTAPTDSPEG